MNSKSLFTSSILTVFFFATLLVSCKRDNEPIPQLTIDHFSPSSGVADGVQTSVIIIGTNFSANIASNEVKFNGITATVDAATVTSITTHVPTGATTGKIAVTVNGLTAISVSDFVVFQSPTITSLSPTAGIASTGVLTGTTIVINGTNFSSSASSNEVKFDGVASPVSVATTTQLTTTVPAGASTGKITVTVNGLTAVSAADFEVLKDIPRSGLIAFYPFDGTANDASGNNLNGILSNGPTLSTDRFGIANHAYSFDGINDFIDMGNPAALQIKGEITLSLWGNADSFVDPPNNRFVGNPLISKFEYTGTAPTQGYYFSQGYGIFTCYSVPVNEIRILKVEDGPLPSANTWIHFVLVFDGGSWRYYKNGLLIYSETAFNGNILDNGSYGNFRIGVLFSGGTYYYKGSIDDVAVYNRALSDDEVLQLFQQTITKY